MRKSFAGICPRTRAVTTPTAPSTIAATESRFNGGLEAPREGAVDQHHRAADVGGTVGAEEGDDVADLAGRAQALERNRSEIVGRRAVRVDLADPLGVDASRRDAVHRDTPRAELAGEGLRPAQDPGADG